SARKLNADSVIVDDLVVDLRNAGRSAAANAGGVKPPGKGTEDPAPGAAKPTPFDGLLKQLQLPVDVRVGMLSVQGKALLPDNQTATFALKGANIEAGQNGKLEWTADFADSTVGAVLQSMRTSGTLSVHITPDRRIDLVEIAGNAAALGPKLPADQFQLNLKAEQPTAGGIETYALSLGRANNGGVEPLLKTAATWTPAVREIAGTWELGIRSEQLAALLAGLGLPEIAANGAGKFNVKPDTQAANASGSLRAHVAQLATLSPDLAAVGSVDLVTGFDGALADGVARLDKLDLELTAADGRKFAQLGLLQKISFRLSDQSVTLADPRADAARIALQALPLAWAQPLLKPMVIESGDLSLTLAIEAEPDGSRVRVKTIDPVALRNVTIRDAEKKAVVEKTTVTLRPAIDYSPTKVSAQLAAISISTPAGDSAAGNISVDATELKTKPVVTFVSQLTAKVVSAHKPFLPAGLDVGPLDVALASEGRHEGNTVRLTKSVTTVTRAGSALLVSEELLQPVEFDLKTQSFTFANPGAAAVRLRMGEIPLAWGEAFVPKSKFSGVFAGATLELSLRAIDDLGITTTEPILLRAIAVTMDGKPLLQGLDLSAAFGGTLRGKSVGFELKRLEARQGETVLASVTAKGETTLATKATLTAKGDLEADVAALTRQPALAQFATLSRGRVTAGFDATVADLTTAKLVLAVKELVAKQGNQPLGTIDTTVSVSLKPDGSGSVNAPLTLTNATRKSDLTIDGTFGKASDKETFIFDGKVSSANLIVDDFQALAALAPASSSAASTPAPNRPGPTVVRAPRPATPAPTTPAPRDTQPFWKGVNGKAELDLQRVLYGKDYVVSGIRGRSVITNSKLSLDGLEGRFNENPFKVTAGVTFDGKQPKPYVMTGAANVSQFDVGEFLRAANPSQKPSLESKITINAKLNGSGINLDDLGQGVYGQFELDGTKGVTRALARTGGAGQAAGLASTALAIFGEVRGSDTASALGRLTAMLNEMAFDKFTLRAERGADLNLKVSTLEFISPTMRLTGSGGLTKAAGANTPIQDQQMKFDLQLAGKEEFGLVLAKLGILSGNKDAKGYSLMSQAFTIGGTPAKPDTSALWKFLLAQGASRAAPALGDFLKKLK
ncbi:MAG: hypothetical protein ABIQ12_00455, partial [Opitutaceae bacterium]